MIIGILVGYYRKIIFKEPWKSVGGCPFSLVDRVMCFVTSSFEEVMKLLIAPAVFGGMRKLFYMDFLHEKKAWIICWMQTGWENDGITNSCIS